MWTGGGTGGAGFGAPGDVGALAQQYWKALSEAMRSASGTTHAQTPWQPMIDSWSQLVGGARRNDASDTVERFSAQARQWFDTMQQVAGQFAGRQASAADIAGAWKQAMGGGNPFASLFSEMNGRGQSGFEQWYAQAAPMINGMFRGGMFGADMFGAGMPGSGMPGGQLSNHSMLGDLRQEGMQWLQTPAFGLNREHQERWQALVAAQLDLQQKNDAYSALMLEAGREAFNRFEHKLAERSEPGRQLQSARALFDLWIDAAEEAYAGIALSARFRNVYGELVNAQMRVRAGLQREVELLGGLFGMPGRTEVDAVHRKVAELERQLWRQRRDAQASAADEEQAVPGESGRSRPAAAKAGTSARKKSATKRVAKAGPAPAKTSKATPKSARAAVKPATRRAPRQAIAAIAMPEPLKPMPAIKQANRKR